MTQGKNFSGQVIPSIIDTEYKDCNFSQPQPVDIGGGIFIGVRLFPGDNTPRTFTHCNLINCEVPPNSIVVDCNTTIIQNSLFSRMDSVTIDGVLISLNHYKNIVHGRWTSNGYVYGEVPTEYETN